MFNKKEDRSVKSRDNSGQIITGNGNTINNYTVSFDEEKLFDIIKSLPIPLNKEEFLKEYFGKDWEQVLLNPQTYYNLKSKLKEVNNDTQKLLAEKKDLLKRVGLQKLNGSIQQMVQHLRQKAQALSL